MQAPGGAGGGRGGGQGMGRGQGQGNSGNRMGMGGVTSCKCPKCGHTEDHERGVPCLQKKCPKCGASMVGV